MPMDFKETMSTALDALLGNKLRTGLAILGIVIGIAAVVGLIALGQGTQAQVTERISSIGSNLLTISSSATNQGGGVQGAAGSANTLTLEDAQAIADNASLTTVEAVSAEVSRNYQATQGRNNTNARVTGALPDYRITSNITMASGTFLSDRNIVGIEKVAVLGPNVVEDLFGTGGTAVGQTIQINRIPFKVIGVTVAKGGGGFGSSDDGIFVPVTTAQKLLAGTGYVSSISVAAVSAETMNQTMDEVGMFLLRRHHLTNPTEADFTIRSQADLLNAVTETTSTFTNLLSGIAAISLLVGGIGIMNIMLVTITERTREIGIRKAIGAKKKDILLQFLLESAVLTIVGGIFGILLGFGISFLASRLLNLTASYSLYGPLLAFTVSTAIGIIFGYYPARRAAQLQPIVALHYE
ncbi:MAG: ABC transporter permease [Candidatus Andersenbacteria bacterium]|nr:ABC transporter permease [Candidatus Andersenbacteria bacterium]MBI3250838.1 ABC transporter permease [Candidatus Andersenbacteria bacterium]